jgi:hypothetical protein
MDPRIRRMTRLRRQLGFLTLVFLLLWLVLS